MKTSKTQNSKAIFTDYKITDKEMINIRGGEGDVIIKPINPPIVV